MAERRMFAKTIIDSDMFLDMPTSTRLLYFDLSMRADDDGFINNPKKIARMTGASEDDLKLLAAKQFIIPFESGIVVIKHWKIHNYIQRDRYKCTMHQYEKALLCEDENKVYSLDTDCIQNVSRLDTQVRLGKSKDSIGKSKDKEKRADKTTLTPTLEELTERFDVNLAKTILEWLEYKKQRKDKYTPIGLKSLLTQIENKTKEYESSAIVSLINLCMSNGWKGIIWDKLKNAQGNYNTPYQKPQDTYNPNAYKNTGGFDSL